MTRLRLPLALLLLLCATVASAQVLWTLQKNATSGNGIPMTVSGFTVIGIQIVGSSSANRIAHFEVSTDGTTYTSTQCRNTQTNVIATQSTVTGAQLQTHVCDVASKQTFRARITGGTSGTVTITVVATQVSGGIGGGGGGGGGGSPSVGLAGTPQASNGVSGFQEATLDGSGTTLVTTLSTLLPTKAVATLTGQDNATMTGGVGTTAVLVQCYDSTGQLIEPSTVAVSSTTFDIAVTFTTPISGHCDAFGVAGAGGPGGGGGGGGAAYTTIQDEGSSLPQQAILNLTGAGVNCVNNVGQSRTDCTIPLTPAGTGDVSGPSSSVDSEIALFSGTDGKTLKRASTTGILKGTAGVIGAATAGTDYQAPLGFTAENVANKSTTTGLGSSNTLYPSQNAVKTYVDTGLAGKESLSNKSAVTALGTSDTLYPTQNAVKVYVDTGLALKEIVANKSTSTALGTSDTLYPSQNAVKVYVDTGLALREVLTNKSTSTSLGTSNTLYPSQNAVKTYVDTGLAGKENTLGFTAVPNTRTVAGHPLSSNVTVGFNDLAAGTSTVALVIGAGGTLAPSSTGVITANTTRVSDAAETVHALVTSGPQTLDCTAVIWPFQVGSGGVQANLPAASTATCKLFRLRITDTGVGNLTLHPNGSDTLNYVNADMSITGKKRGFDVQWQSSTGWEVMSLSDTVDLNMMTNLSTTGRLIGSGSASAAVVELTPDSNIYTSGTTLKVNSAGFPTTYNDSDHTITSADDGNTVVCNITTGTNRTVTLPAAAGAGCNAATCRHGYVIRTGAGGGRCDLAPNGTDTLNGVNAARTTATAAWQGYEYWEFGFGGWRVQDIQ